MIKLLLKQDSIKGESWERCDNYINHFTAREWYDGEWTVLLEKSRGTCCDDEAKIIVKNKEYELKYNGGICVDWHLPVKSINVIDLFDERELELWFYKQVDLFKKELAKQVELLGKTLVTIKDLLKVKSVSHYEFSVEFIQNLIDDNFTLRLIKMEHLQNNAYKNVVVYRGYCNDFVLPKEVIK